MSNMHEEYRIRWAGMTLTIPRAKLDQVYQALKAVDAQSAYAFNAIRHTVQTSGGDVMNVENDMMVMILEAVLVDISQKPREDQS